MNKGTKMMLREIITWTIIIIIAYFVFTGGLGKVSNFFKQSYRNQGIDIEGKVLIDSMISCSKVSSIGRVGEDYAKADCNSSCWYGHQLNYEGYICDDDLLVCVCN